MGDPFADALLRGLPVGGGGEAEFGQDGFVGEAVEGDAESGSAPGGERGIDFDHGAIYAAGESAEDPVNALEGEGALLFGEAAAGNVFGEDDGRRRLALDAGWEKLLGGHLDARADEAADESGEEAFGDGALPFCTAFAVAHAGIGCVVNDDRPVGGRLQIANRAPGGGGQGRAAALLESKGR